MGKNDKTTYRYDLFSKYRAMLMGCAIVGVVMSHWKDNLVDHGIHPNYLALFLIRLGYVLFEIFIFGSGFGLYYSCKRHKASYFDFLKKRVLRILPDYLVIGGITWIITDLLIDKCGFGRFLEDITFISFFTRGNLRYWYVITIIIYYALFPVVFSIIEGEHKHPVAEFCGFLAAFWLITAVLHSILPNYDKLNLAIERFPMFVFGAICGKYAMKGKTIPGSALWVIAMIGFGLAGACLVSSSFKSFLKSVHYFYYFSCSCSGLAGIIAIIAIMEFFEKHNKGIWQEFSRVFGCLGGVTLETYLFHQSYRHLFNRPYTVFGYFGGLVILPIVSAFAYKWLKELAMKKGQHK